MIIYCNLNTQFSIEYMFLPYLWLNEVEGLPANCNKTFFLNGSLLLVEITLLCKGTYLPTIDSEIYITYISIYI